MERSLNCLDALHWSTPFYTDFPGGPYIEGTCLGICALFVSSSDANSGEHVSLLLHPRILSHLPLAGPPRLRTEFWIVHLPPDLGPPCGTRSQNQTVGVLEPIGLVGQREFSDCVTTSVPRGL